jgi:hypothetical protein
MNPGVHQDQVLEAIEALRFVAERCTVQPEELDVALGRFTATYYPAHHLSAEVMDVADQLARSLGFADSTLEPVK